MNTLSRAERRRGLREQKAAVRRAQRELRERQKAEGLKAVASTTILNGKSEWTTVEEEKQARQEAVEEQLRVFRHVLPTLLKQFGKIRDPRNPKTSKHKLTVLMLYGVVAFVFQMTSRREANREMTMPQFQENLRLLFPELDTTPHQDTLNRLLGKIPVDRIQDTLLDLIGGFIRNKKFCRYLVSNRYAIVMDGNPEARP